MSEVMDEGTTSYLAIHDSASNKLPEELSHYEVDYDLAASRASKTVHVEINEQLFDNATGVLVQLEHQDFDLPIARESITDKIKTGIFNLAHSDMFRSSSQVLKGGMQTVGSQLVTVKDDLMGAVQSIACTGDSTRQDREVSLAAPQQEANIFAPAPEVYRE